MDLTQDGTDENEDIDFISTLNTELPGPESIDLFTFSKTRIPLDVSKNSIKQEEPEADHDYLYDQALNAPFRSSRNHIIKAFKVFNEMRKRKILCDVTLKTTDETEISGHKIILSGCSSYFKAMFSGSMCESKASVVLIKGVSGNALETLINFIYTCEIHVNEENVQALLPAANQLQLSEVKDACCEFLQHQLHPSNCLGIQQFADLHCCKDLLQSSRQFCENHFRDIMNHDEFVHLTVDNLESLVSSNSLSASEEEVFESIKRWITFDVDSRRQYLYRLFSNVRFRLLSREFLVKLTKEDELIRSELSCKDLLIDGMSYHLMSADDRLQHKVIPRTPITDHQILMVIGGQAPKAVRSIEEYDFKTEQWTQVTELPSRRCRCGTVLNKGLVYVVGGFNGTLRVRTVDMYDPSQDKWEVMAQMSARRSTLGVAALDGLIYAVGGFDGTQGLASAEVYDPVTNTWRNIASMTTRRSSVGLTVMNGQLYVVGGYDGLERECLASVECYRPNDDVWVSVPSMSCRRSGAAVASLDGVLYAIGGHDGPNVKNTVERYCYKRNLWTPVASMIYARRNAGVVCHDNLLYVVGGEDGTTNLNSVECYDPHSDSWSLLSSPMAIGRSYSGVLLVPRSSRRS